MDESLYCLLSLQHASTDFEARKSFRKTPWPPPPAPWSPRLQDATKTNRSYNLAQIELEKTLILLSHSKAGVADICM